MLIWSNTNRSPGKIVYDPDSRITQPHVLATEDERSSMTKDRPWSGPGRGSDGNVNAWSDEPTASKSESSTGNGVSGFSYPQPLSFIPIH